jgi:hypothetical protein
MILLLLGILHLVGGTLIADSLTDFSGTQGAGGWYYRYDGGDYFAELPTFDVSWLGSGNSWQYTDSWCQLGAYSMHTTTGGGDAACSTPVGYCAPILKWENPNHSANLTLTLAASHTFPLDATRDGVILNLKVNGALVDSLTTPFNVTNNYGPFNISFVELILDPKNSCNTDGTDYRLQIYTIDPSPSSTITPSQSPTPSQSVTTTQTVTPSISFTSTQTLTPSESATPSQTATETQTATPSVSFTSTKSLTPSDSPTPSQTASETQTKTQTPSRSPSRTPSPSPTGICNTIFSNLYGTQEILDGGGVFFTVNHGANITHYAPYAVCGRNPTCVDNGASCVCTYTSGDSFSCNVQRSSVITYTLGPNRLLYTGQSPSCHYMFSRAFSFPSPTPSPTITPSHSSTASMTRTTSGTPSYTPTPSANGICNDIRNYVNGRLETVMQNDTQYNLFHGRYITTPYLENFDMLLGVFNSCTDHGQSCICNYDHGYNLDCPGGVHRNAVVNFTFGSKIETGLFNQSDCSYSFNASYLRPSVTPSPTLTQTSTASWTATPTKTITNTPSATETNTVTTTTTLTTSQTETQTPSLTSTPTQTVTPTQTASVTMTQTATVTSTFSPTVTPTGICNDVRNYVFGRRDTPTVEYTIRHGDQMTHYYYPGQYVLIGHAPTCTDRGDECVCVYGDGDPSFCTGGRRGIVRYSYDSAYRTFLVNDTDPVCLYQFNTTFFLPYLSPTATRTITPSPFPTYVPRFRAGRVRFLPPPPGLPPIPSNASMAQLGGLAEGYITTLNMSNGDATDILAALASTLAAVSGNLSLSVAGDGFTWAMMPATETASVSAGNVSAVLPPLADGMVYSFVSTQSNSSFPTFSVDALGTAVNKFTITDLSTPMQFSVTASPAAGQKIECVYWNGTDWDTTGCTFANGTCACTHFTEFSARFAAIADTNAALFGAAGDVYSIAGFKKYASVYGLLIGLFLGIAGLFIFLLKLDARGEMCYRLAVEEIDEVCKVLGFERPHSPQPVISLPKPVNRQPVVLRICSAWISRLFYHHSYFGIFFRYDPRLPRGFRLLSLTIVAFHTLFLTVLLYGYSKVGGEMTVIESIVLSLITAGLNIPFIRGLMMLNNLVGAAEYQTRFPDFAHEYARRRGFESALRSVSTLELQRVVDRMNAGKTPGRAVMVSPGSRREKRGSVEAVGDATQLGDDNTDAFLVTVFDQMLRRCCPRRQRQRGFEIAMNVAAESDPHYTSPACGGLPTKTLRGLVFSCAGFVYIGWIMNYLLLFTASQSTAAAAAIASSFGISQATSILITQPLTLFLTLFGTWVLSRVRRHNSRTNHIGYFADPFFQNSSTSLSGSWAYWIFLYGGAAGSLGMKGERRPIGYSSTAVALAWLNGITEVGTTPRDAALTTLYVYLRGIQKPLVGRAAVAAAAAAEIRGLLESTRSSLVPEAAPTDEETGDVVEIVKIAADTKDAGSRIIS